MSMIRVLQKNAWAMKVVLETRGYRVNIHDGAILQYKTSTDSVKYRHPFAICGKHGWYMHPNIWATLEVDEDPHIVSKIWSNSNIPLSHIFTDSSLRLANDPVIRGIYSLPKVYTDVFQEIFGAYGTYVKQHHAFKFDNNGFDLLVFQTQHGMESHNRQQSIDHIGIDYIEEHINARGYYWIITKAAHVHRKIPKSIS